MEAECKYHSPPALSMSDFDSMPRNADRRRGKYADWAYQIASNKISIDDTVPGPSAVMYLASTESDGLILSNTRPKSARNYSTYSEDATDSNDIFSEASASGLKRSKSFSSLSLSDEKSSPVSNTVLVVDDNAICRRVLSHTLSGLGYQYELAADGFEACKLVEANRNQYCAILMDFRMPEMNGLDASSYIRNILKSKIPVIIITGEKFESLAPVKDAGADEVLYKPVNSSDISEVFVNLQIGIEIIKWKDGSKSYFEINSLPRYDSEFIDLCNGLQCLTK
jgi:CheY-like chemotaxis protein